MKLPKIEERVLQKRNNIAFTSAFFGLGAGIFVATCGLSAIHLLMVAIPLGIDVYTLSNLGNENRKYKTGLSLYEPFFKLGMSRWVKNYLKKSDNLIEKKYKAVFLHSWLKYKKLSIDDLVYPGFKAFDELFYDLKSKKLSNYLLYSSAAKWSSTSLSEFLHDDKNHPERLEIAKKVYQEYSNVGMAGNAFLENEDFNSYLLLQDNKFTKKDYEVIDACPIISNDHPMFRVDIVEYPEESKNALKTIIENEHNLNNLNILKKFCIKKLKQADELIDKVNSIKDFKELLEIKIEYIELGKELGLENNKANKKNKIKI
jgi:hypothetical protein